MSVSDDRLADLEDRLAEIEETVEAVAEEIGSLRDTLTVALQWLGVAEALRRQWPFSPRLTVLPGGRE